MSFLSGLLQSLTRNAPPHRAVSSVFSTSQNSLSRSVDDALSNFLLRHANLGMEGLSSCSAGAKNVPIGQQIAEKLARLEAAAAAGKLPSLGAALLEAVRDPFVYIQHGIMKNVVGTLNPSLWKWYHRHGRRFQGSFYVWTTGKDNRWKQERMFVDTNEGLLLLCGRSIDVRKILSLRLCFCHRHGAGFARRVFAAKKVLAAPTLLRLLGPAPQARRYGILATRPTAIP